MRFIKSGLIQAICLIIALSGCGGEDARKASYLEKGKTYLAEGNYDKARVEIKNVLQIDPKFTEGYYIMGLVEEKRQNLRLAFAYFTKTTELDPAHIRAHAKIGRFYAISGDLNNAQKKLDTIFAIDPQSMDGKLLKMIIVARTDKKKAIDFSRKILAEDYSQLDAIRMLAMLHTKAKEYDKAIAVLKKGIKHLPEERTLKLQLAEVYARTDDFKNAEIILKEIIALDPESLASHLKLASFYAQRNEVDKAEQAFRNIISINPADETGYLLLAEFQSRSRSVREAEKTLLSAIKNNPELSGLQFALARLYKVTKSEKEASVYREIIKLNDFSPEGLRARIELAKIVLSQKDLDGASKLINEVLDNNPGDNDALLLKGRIAIVQKNYNEAIGAFRTVIKHQPELVEAVTLLSTSHMQNNDPELAAEVLKRGIINAPANPEMYINYANHLQKLGDFKAAEKEIDKLLRISPKHLKALKMKVKYAINRRDMNEVRAMIEKIRTTYPEKPEGYQQMGGYYAANKQYQKAFEEYETASKKSKTLLPSLASIIKLHLLQKQYNKAATRLTGIIKDQPENAIPYELLGEVYIAQKEFTEAEKNIRKAIKLNSNWSLPYVSYASLYLAQKDIKGAIRIYQQALETLPKDTQIMTNLAKIHEDQDDHEKAMIIYEKILTIDPANAIAASNLAVLLADRKADTVSLQRAKKLAMRFEKSTNPGFLDVIGWIYYKTGEFEKSLPLLEKTVEKARNIPIFQYHLGMAYYKTGNQDAARMYLKKALESEQKFQGREQAEQIIKSL